MPEPNSGCQLWLGACNGAGYGCLQERRNAKKVTVMAHRASWEHHRGPIPEGLFVCHRCDVPGCINPDHLFLGDHQANMDDMTRKGRSGMARGERNSIARLTVADVIAIRADGRTLAAIAESYGVSLSCVDHVKARRNWRHV